MRRRVFPGSFGVGVVAIAGQQAEQRLGDRPVILDNQYFSGDDGCPFGSG